VALHCSAALRSSATLLSSAALRHSRRATGASGQQQAQREDHGEPPHARSVLAARTRWRTGRNSASGHEATSVPKIKTKPPYQTQLTSGLMYSLNVALLALTASQSTSST